MTDVQATPTAGEPGDRDTVRIFVPASPGVHHQPEDDLAKDELVRRRDALAKDRKDLDRRSAAIHDSGNLRADEAALDEARRELVKRWAAMDEIGRILRSENAWLDKRRAALADEEEDLRNLSERLESMETEMSEIHRVSGHSPEYVSLLRTVTPTRSEHTARRDQISARIAEYNHRYDAFIQTLSSHMSTADELTARLKDWIAKRHNHNDAINEVNTAQALLRASHEVLDNDEIRLMEDISTYLGPFRLPASAKNELAHQFNVLIWKSDDRNIAGLQFELVCKDLLERMDLDVTHTGGSDDRGIDMHATAKTPTGGRYRYLIQCKLRSRGDAIGVNTIAKFVGRLPNAKEYDKAAVVTSGDFDDDARTLASERNIELWNGAWLLEQLVKNNVGFNLGFNIDGYSIGVNQECWDELEKRTDPGIQRHRA